MKKRLFAVLAAMVLSMTTALPVFAESDINWNSIDWSNPNYDALETNDFSPSGSDYRKAAEAIINQKENNANSSKIKVSGPANVSTTFVYSDEYDQIYDNGIYPTVYEFAKNSVNTVAGRDNASKAKGEDIDSIYYFNVKGDEPGEVTFRMSDGYLTPGGYAIVLHYTGNPMDQDGVTAQYVKVSSGNTVKAYMSSYGPVAIIATSTDSAQKLVNTYYLTAGTDAQMGFAATIVSGENAPIFILTGAAILAVIAGTIVYKKKKATA